MRTGRYVAPSECGLNSEGRAVGRRLADVMNSLAQVNTWVLEPCGVLRECERFKERLRDKLRADGWRVTTGKTGERWHVLPPKGYPNDKKPQNKGKEVAS